MAILSSTLVEKFRHELTGTFRAISGKDDARVEFSLVPSFGNGIEVNYQPVEQSLSFRFPTTDVSDFVDEIRGHCDRVAAQIRWHDTKIDEQQKPKGTLATQREWFELLEKTRTDLVAGEYYKGAGNNIFQLWQAEVKEAVTNSDTGVISPQQLLALSLYLKQSGQKPTPEMAKLVPFMQTIEDLIKTGNMGQLQERIEDQTAFAQKAKQIIAQLVDIPPSQPEEERSEEENPSSMESDISQDNEDMQVPSTFDEQEGEEDSPANTQKIQSLLDDQRDDGNEDERNEATAEENHIEHEDNKDEVESSPVALGYRAFTTQFDEVLRPQDMASPEELVRYRKQLDVRLEEMRDISQRLARKLQRQLMARQLRSWDFHMEEGMLDPAKLSTVITDPTYPFPFKWERQIEEKNTVISILLDNSGSMRGRPITIAALCADILIRTLERCNIKTEILGFTTAEWKGGKSKKAWLDAGSPPLPGRLNDLRHIIYKDAASTWRKSKNNLGLMLKEGILKENIDGEAILWAHERLMVHGEDRKILMVISDGAPVDDSTLSANAGHYILDRHLRDVIKTIERNRQVELMAIGIGHNVEKLYSRALTIHQVDELGEAMVTHLSRLFDKAHSSRPLRAKTL